ncbi:MAG TPA: 30S ribosomal protein S6 [Candidatus Polarisedimenticolaceae bacterium]|nr:30S ribosomal protein S6 [Candidatus Polarisedimenticolaceae bacterium]
MVRTYETVFITVPTLTDEEDRGVVDALATVVSDGGGVFTANDRMGRRRLAYPIKKFEDGVYTRFLFDSEPVVPKELDRRLRINDKVIRHMTVLLEPDWAVAAKEQAVRDAQARADAEAARAAGVLIEATEAPAPRGRGERDEDDGEFDERD